MNIVIFKELEIPVVESYNRLANEPWFKKDTQKCSEVASCVLKAAQNFVIEGLLKKQSYPFDKALHLCCLEASSLYAEDPVALRVINTLNPWKS